MASFDLAFNTRKDGVVVLQTLLESGIQVGDTVTIAGNAVIANGNYKVLSTEAAEFTGVDQYGDFEFDYNVIIQNQFLVLNAGADVTRSVATGTVTFTPSVTWIVNADVVAWLGIDSATSNDTAFITTCVAAANYWCWNKRRESNYADSLTTVPDASVKLGTIMYAATLYRERGTSGDSYASYDGFGNQPQPVTLARIMQLLGASRASVA
jgi:hypothetical protein